MDSLPDNTRYSMRQIIQSIAELTGTTEQTIITTVLITGIGLGSYVAYKLLFSSSYDLPPGPKPLPLIGNLHNIGKNPRSYIGFHELKEQYGDILTFYLGPTRVILLSSAELVREAYLRDGVTFADRPKILTLDMVSDGGQDIVGAPYCTRMQLQRKIALAALRQYIAGSTLDTHASNVFADMRKRIDKNGSFQPNELGYLFAYNLIASMCFGKKFDLNDPYLQDMMKLQSDFEEVFNGPGAFVLLLPFMKYFPTKVTKIAQKFTKVSHEFLGKCLEDHLKTYDPDDLSDFTYHMIYNWREVEKDPNEKNKLKHLTNKHFQFILLDLFLAGTDTTRQTLAWIWQYLAAYPEIQRKAQKEIDEVLGDNSVNANSRKDLPYIDAIIHEVMRIMPVLPIGLPRQTMEDTKLQGYDIPKGSMIMCNTWSIHHDDKSWHKPYEFNPERWLDEHGQYVFQQNGFVPFSLGLRSCVGESFAKLEIHMLTSMMLQTYTLKPEPGKQIILEPINSGIVRAPDQVVVAEIRKK